MSSLIERSNAFKQKYQTFDLITPNEKKQSSIGEYEDEQSSDRASTFPSDAFEIGKDSDNTTKYTFDSIYQDLDLIRVAQDYYENRDGIRYDAEDVIDEFVSDRTWKQANTLSMMDELDYVLSKDTDVKQKERLAYLMQYWNQLPNFYQEGGRGWWAGLSANIGRGMIDPLNYVGGFLGGQVVKQGVKKAGQELLKKSVQKKVIRDATVKGTGLMAATDATIFGGADAILQKTEMEVGMREQGNYDLSRVGTSMITGAGVSIAPAALGAFGAAKRGTSIGVKNLGGEVIDDLEIKNSTGIKSVDDAINNKGADKSIKSKDPFTKLEQAQPLVNRYERVKAYIFDKYNPMRVIQEKITGVKGSVEGLKGAYNKTNMKYDPVTNPYFMFRMLVGSNTRADDFAKDGVKIMSDIDAKDFKYTATGNKGFLEVLKPFNDQGHGETLLSYIGALRSNKIRQNASELPVGKKRNAYLKNAMFTQADADKIIDYAELSPSAFFKKYKEQGTKPNLDFIQGAKDIKKFFDDLLKYQKQSGILDQKQIRAIQKAHPFYIPFYGQGKVGDKIDLHTDALTRTVSAIGAPAKKKLSDTSPKTAQDFKPLFESSLDYAYSSVIAADKNLAKRTFYRMIDEGEKKGVIEKGQVVKEITGTTQLKNVRAAITQSAIEKLEDMGVKVDASSLDPSNQSFSVMAFADNIIDKADAVGMGAGKKIDIFYDKGKFRAFVVEDEALAGMYRNFDNNTNNILNKISKFTEPFARIPSQAITHSPPFIAFNFIRDTLSGSVNSAFGFKPGYSTLKGLKTTAQGVGNPNNVKEYINMFKRSDVYRRALVSGMGYSSRADTEKYLKFGKKFSDTGTSAANGFYKKSLRYMMENYGGLKPAARGYSEFVSRVEYATRLAEFEYAKKAGFGDVGAAFAAREIATDFGMSGSGRILNLYSRNTMFFNAGLQGFYRGIRRFKENPKKFGATVGAIVVAPEIALWTLNNERPEYEEVPEEVKQLNYLIPIFVDDQPDGSHKHPNGMRRVERFIPIPKPYDFGVFANIAVGIMETFQENSSAIGVQYMLKSLNQIMPGSGFYRGGAPGTNIAGIAVPFIEEPGFLRPWADLAFNHDWVGANITPYGLEKLPPHMRIKTNTRESVVRFAQFMNELTSPSGSNRSFLTNVPGANKLINPVEMDYILNSYFTGLLSYPFDIADAMAWNEDKFGERPLRRDDQSDFKNAPWSIVTKRFNVNTPVKASENIRTLYEINKKAQAVVAADFEMQDSMRYLMDITDLKQNFSSEDLNQFRAVSSLLTEVLQQLSDLRNLRDSTRFMKNLSAEQKRTQIDEYRTIENQIARDMIKILAEADFDKVMKSQFFGNKYNTPKEPFDPLGFRDLFDN